MVGSSKLYVSFAKEPYKRDCILQKRPIILRSLLIVATPYARYSLLHLEYHSISISNPNLVDLFIMKLGKRDLEKETSD